jgi:hypothetical protein
MGPEPMRCTGWLLATGLALPCAMAHAAGVFFDDFSHADRDALAAAGWTLRTSAGHPGVPGAAWRADAVSLLDDPTRRGNRLLRLTARTDGTPAGTVQAQLCHARKLLDGTYAARVRFSDEPVEGQDGDPAVQAFYAVAPLRHDFDPQFSEIDWEYLPNGGWGSERTRLYAISWQTARIEPWQAHNSAHEAFGSHLGWRTLVMQVAHGKARHFLDGRQLIEHGGRNVPVVPMAIAFSLWFSPGGLLPRSAAPRVYQQDIDWVFHAQGRVLSPAQVAAEVRALRLRGAASVDTVPAAEPPLDSRCDF